MSSRSLSRTRSLSQSSAQENEKSKRKSFSFIFTEATKEKKRFRRRLNTVGTSNEEREGQRVKVSRMESIHTPGTSQGVRWLVFYGCMSRCYITDTCIPCHNRRNRLRGQQNTWAIACRNFLPNSSTKLDSIIGIASV